MLCVIQYLMRANGCEDEKVNRNQRMHRLGKERKSSLVT